MRSALFLAILLVLIASAVSWRRRRRRRCAPQNCEVGSWTSWSHCNQACGQHGTQRRMRTKTKSESCGGKCSFVLVEMRSCNRLSCAGKTLKYRLEYVAKAWAPLVYLHKDEKFRPSDVDFFLSYVNMAIARTTSFEDDSLAKDKDEDVSTRRIALLDSPVAEDDDQTMALKYLNQFHYISPARSGNHDVKTALEKFQSFAGLPVTGEIDAATIAQMKIPRCGMPDVDDDRLRIRSKWNKKHLTYHISYGHISYGQDLSHSVQDRVFPKALDYWAQVSGLSFSRTVDGKNADLKIRNDEIIHLPDFYIYCTYFLQKPVLTTIKAAQAGSAIATITITSSPIARKSCGRC
ncbi:predicted protein [Nematostella vectensis]|uniref:Peptidoglycan binding-like domain-containing protein n=1 Tax=Nematostella vectensis TaxID=45351 RepID=A7SM14_NEMVE|nr:predicted protein [Nematostella vectensis]|eukprot:XP_001627346.1 predicted protein [Nematostella vectensis]